MGLHANIQFSQYCGVMWRTLVCNLYSTQRPPSGCRSSGTDRHLLLPTLGLQEITPVSTATRQRKYSFTRIFPPPVPLYDRGRIEIRSEEKYAVLGTCVLGGSVDRRGLWIHWRCCRLSRHRKDLVHYFPGVIPYFTGDSLRQGKHRPLN